LLIYTTCRAVKNETLITFVAYLSNSVPGKGWSTGQELKASKILPLRKTGLSNELKMRAVDLKV